MTSLKQHLRDSMSQNTKLFLDDLKAIPDEQLSVSPGGCARTPADLSYEVSFVARRIAMRFRGETPDPWTPMPWTKAPEGYRAKEQMIEDLESSRAELLAAWEAFPEDQLETPIAVPSGHTSALELASIAARHPLYHDAQLAYIQTLSGDDAMHWEF